MMVCLNMQKHCLPNVSSSFCIKMNVFDARNAKLLFNCIKWHVYLNMLEQKQTKCSFFLLWDNIDDLQNGTKVRNKPRIQNYVETHIPFNLKLSACRFNLAMFNQYSFLNNLAAFFPVNALTVWPFKLSN